MQAKDRAARRIRRNLYARCPFSAAIERAEYAMHRYAFFVLVVDDTTDSVRRHDALEITWNPHTRLFPRAQALLTVRPHAPQGTELQLSLVYQPPLGTVGLLFDRLIGRHIAWLTAGIFLRELRRAIVHDPLQA
jgi:hypothetical protein